ncbi:MAG TPA: type 1 glutamine amidotransferase domain-containing protein [Jatrophihabitantaceae bacterium]|jgi:protease I
MPNDLSGKRVAFLVANVGVEQVELTSPWQAVKDAGGEPALLAPETGKVQAVQGDLNHGDNFEATQAVGDAHADDYAALVLPGGVASPDKLRIVPEAVDFVASFARAGKPIAAICHGPWTLVEADVVRGKTLTSWPSLQTDIRNAGGTWQDAEVITSDDNGWTLVTSRKPDDLDAFNQAAISAFVSA